MQATGLPAAVLLRCLQLRRLPPSQTAFRVLRAHKRPSQLALHLRLLLHPRLLRHPKPRRSKPTRTKRTTMIPAAAASRPMTTSDSRATRQAAALQLCLPLRLRPHH